VRIVGGTFLGRKLTSPGSRVRPTSEEVRGVWIEALLPHLDGARVLDLFAGSGALGLEAISRGAATADFVENGPASLHSLKANLATLRVGRRTKLFKRDVIPFVEGLGPGSYDVTFADPPYGSGKLDRVVSRWLDVPFSHLLSFEHHRDHRLPGRGKTLKFDDTRVTILVAD
jgi:16S rRNA (guanine966-N2)-methyltransferase